MKQQKLTTGGIADGIRQVMGLSQLDSHRAVEAVLQEIKTALVSGRRVMLHDFGTFSVRTLRARVGRNPKTGATITIPARNKVAFKSALKV